MYLHIFHRRQQSGDPHQHVLRFVPVLYEQIHPAGLDQFIERGRLVNQQHLQRIHPCMFGQPERPEFDAEAAQGLKCRGVISVAESILQVADTQALQ